MIQNVKGAAAVAPFFENRKIYIDYFRRVPYADNSI